MDPHRALRCFADLACLGSITAAVWVLDLAPSVVTRRVTELQRQVGVLVHDLRLPVRLALWRHHMHSNSAPLAHRNDRPVAPWALLTGGSMGTVAGFGIDLLRLGIHEARQAFAAGQRSATCGWRRP